MNLTNLFAAGLRVKSLVDSVIQLQSPVYSILEHIVRVRQSIILASNKTEKSAWEDLAVKLLRKYYLMIAVGLYLHETQGTEHVTFMQWLEVTPTVYDLYNSINIAHIDQYLSVNFGDNSGYMFSNLSLGTSGSLRVVLMIHRYLNVHTLLLQQQVTDQENNIVAKQLLLKCHQREPVFGTIFTKYLVSGVWRTYRQNLKEITNSWSSLPSSVPKHLFIVNIHRSPSVLAMGREMTRRIIDHSLFCLRDRVSPLMWEWRCCVTCRTSPSYANYDNHSEALDQIETSVVKELDAFDNAYFVLSGYNQESHSIENYKQLIRRDAVFTSK